MPFGVIEVASEGPVPGTELLIRKEQIGTSPDGDTSHLKRVMYKVIRSRHFLDPLGFP